jgi:signal transduction histidine kinase
MRRARLLFAGFLLSAALLLGALGWISGLALNLEAGEAEARRHAAFEERVRLSLWRMDSALAAFLAEENARPVDGLDAANRVLDPGKAARPYLTARFEIDPAGRVRESLAPPNVSHHASSRLDRDALLGGLGGGPLAPQQLAASSPVAAKLAPRETRAAKALVLPRSSPAKAQDDPVAREMANQRTLNRVEFEQREQRAGNTAAPAATPTSEGPAGPPSERSSATGSAHPAPDATARPPSSLVTAPSATPGRRPPGAPAGLPHARVLSALSATWAGDDLVLVRRIARGGGEFLQGSRLDGPQVRIWLAAQVRDLLPRAVLFPLRSGEAADPGRRLALLPFRLDPGPLPALLALPATSSIHLGLTAASAAVLLAIAAGGLLLASSLRLARRRSDFVSAVTHELRTPLTTFRLYTEMLAGGMLPAAEQPGYLATLRDEAARLGHLVENVLAFARLERGRRPAALEDVELADLVTEAAVRLGPRAERDGLALVVEMPPEAAAVRVRTDRLAVERILENLVDNACKYGRGAEPQIHLAVHVRDRRAVLTLRDHGPGLVGGRRRLFRPFHRSAADAAGAAPGIGLGLALSRRLARGFGGDLRLVQPAGGGAAFELWLPLAP